MRRKSFQRLRATSSSGHHHHVYVVLLDEAIRASQSSAESERIKPCVYVGMTGLDPNERFANHKSGIKAARVVQKFGIRLLPDLYEHLNPMPFEAAAEMERELADDLTKAGYLVFGGH